VRILYLCHRIPYPPDKGEKIRAFHQLRAMAARHEVDVFTLADDAGDLAHRDALAAHCHGLTIARVRPKLARLRSLPYLFTRTPLTVPYFYSAELEAQVRKAVALRSYDRIFVYCSAMAQYVKSVDDIPIMTDLVDVDSDKWRQYALSTPFPLSAVYRREARCLREYERKICEKSARVFVTTEREAQLARKLSDKIRVHVIPMGVEIGRFDPAPPPDSSVPTIVFTGVMSYFPNQEAVRFFARQVLPLIARSVPGVRFLIVGRNPNRKVRELQKLPGVEVTGYVPDVRTYLAQAHVSVAPFSIATGIQTKILEALAFGLPVVATPRAVQALTRDVAGIIETGESAEELAAKVVRLLRDPQLARSQGMEGRRRVADAYNWDTALQQFLGLIEDYPPGAPLLVPSLSSDKAAVTNASGSSFAGKAGGPPVAGKSGLVTGFRGHST